MSDVILLDPPWVCMHGLNINATGGCVDCEQALTEMLVEARRRYLLWCIDHERRFGEPAAGKRRRWRL